MQAGRRLSGGYTIAGSRSTALRGINEVATNEITHDFSPGERGRFSVDMMPKMTVCTGFVQ
jgi:hypothetical protein